MMKGSHYIILLVLGIGVTVLTLFILSTLHITGNDKGALRSTHKYVAERNRPTLQPFPSPSDLSERKAAKSNKLFVEEEYIRDPSVRNLDDSQTTCKPSFEPTCEMYPYVRFWNKRFHPNDCYESPLRPKGKEKTPLVEQKFIVLEPDCGRLNNMRMAAEVAILFAHATGRTLVLPPVDPRFKLNETDNRSPTSFIFDLSKVSETLTVISMEHFLDHVAKVPGQLRETLPLSTATKKLMDSDRPLWNYLERSCYSERWEPGIQFLGFNISSNIPSLFGTFEKDLKRNIRYRLMIAHGRKLRPYDEKLNREKAIYLRGTCRREDQRILTHFYTYLYFADPLISRIYARIVRDRLHYHDSIFCAAGYIVRAIHEDAAKLTGKAVQGLEKADKMTMGGNTNEDATYFAMHVRRGDLFTHVTDMYTKFNASLDLLAENSFRFLDPKISTLLYISTDEKDLTLFKPFFRGPFEVRFLHHYYTPDTSNENHIGMIEQIVCANAHTFVGSPLSSFTGYINRMRGYYRDGRYSRSYYNMREFERQLEEQRRIKGPFWAREFEVAHRDIDDFYY